MIYAVNHSWTSKRLFYSDKQQGLYFCNTILLIISQLFKFATVFRKFVQSKYTFHYILATPLSLAARETAAATFLPTLKSNALGIIFSGSSSLSSSVLAMA